MNSFARSLPMMLYRTLDAVMPEFRAIFSAFELIERRPGEKDRRHVHVYLRPRGRALEKRVRPRVEDAYARLHGALTQAEWRALYGALDRLIDVRTAEAAHRAHAGVRKAVAARRTAMRRRLGAAPSVERTAASAARKKRP